MNRRKIIDFCILAVAVMLVSFSTVFAADNLKTETTDSTDCIVDTYQNIAEYRNDSEIVQKHLSEGYIYAGSFTDESCTAENALKGLDIEGPVYAKYVSEKILGLKAQVSANLWNDGNKANDETGAIRFVTSVDSLAYKKVGFKITVGPSTKVNEKSSSTVYKQLYANIGKNDADGEKIPQEQYNPQTEFHPSSNFFKTWTITNVTSINYGTEFKVTPFWETLDGMEVTGTQSIKTVNGGRTWEYVFVDDSGDDVKGAGTQENPYQTLEKALSEMQTNKTLQIEAKVPSVDMTGNVYVLNSLTADESFVWNEHGLDVAIKGDKAEKASVVDFSAVMDMGINDDVTLANMTLKLKQGASFAASEKVFLNGHRFIIGEDVVSHNPRTIIYGGGYQKDVDSTYVEIHAGRYCCIYGGGLEGNVQKDTNVVLENTDVYSPNSAIARVHGGGESAAVFGDTHVTLGDGFNSDSGFDVTSHSKLSAVFGGGYSKNPDKRAIVAGDTYVTVKGTARLNYSFGGGYNYSDVQGRCHTNFEGGTAVSIYGGSFASSSGAAGDPKNPHATVVMTGGTVEQIYGGNEYNEMAGDTSVQVLGGTVTRRIYGGCYNNYNGEWKSAVSVAGNTNVTIGPDAKILQETGLLEGDSSICAISRLGENKETETGVMVLNANAPNVKLGFQEMIGVSKVADLYTNYLVNVEEGGLVTAENRILQITPDNRYQYATVTDANGKVLCVVEGKGTYQLPELTVEERTSIQNVTVTFTNEKPATTDFAVKSISGNNTVYYNSLESAVAAAEDDTKIVVLKDVTVNSSMVVSKNITLTSESTVTITRGADFTSGSMFDITGGTFSVQGTPTAQITIDGNASEDTTLNVRGFYVHSGKMFELKYATVKNFRTTGDGGAVRVTENSSADVQNSEFIENFAQVGGAIHILKDTAVTIKDSIFTENHTTTGNGGAVYCAGTYEDTNSSYIGNTSGRHGGAIIVQGGAKATVTGTDAKFSGNTATENANGNAIYVNSGATVNVTGYTFDDNTQKVLAAGTLTFDNITGATLTQGSAGKIYVAGYDDANDITITPNAYTEGTVVLTRAEGVEDSVFEAACAGIKVTPKDGNWVIDETGKLMQVFAARIGETKYDTLEEAITVANADEVIYVLNDVEISKQMTISKNVTITNEPGKDITIKRSASMNSGAMFYVKENTNAIFTLGTNAENEQGKLIVADNGVYKNTTNTRIVDNRANATFKLEKNAVLQGANSNQRGSALVNRGTTLLYGSIRDNICTGDGGAILQVSGALAIYEGTYTGNEATKATASNTAGGLGSVITAIGGTTEIKGGTFSDNITKSRGVIHAVAAASVTISGGSFKNNTVGEGGAIYCYGTLEIAGPITAANDITFTPSEYAENKVVLTKAEGVTDEEFQIACAGIKVTPDADGKAWLIDNNGQLQNSYVARIGETKYDTFTAAIDAAKASGGTGDTADVVVYVRSDVELSSGVTINKNIKIQNEPGVDVTIRRSGNIVMFTVSSGARFTLGTNDEVAGRLIVDGATTTAVSSRMVQNPAGATFILGKNAILQNANVNNWGTALNNAGTADLYGSVINNTSTAAGGAILQSNANAKLTIHEGNYTGNKATRTTTVSQGSAIIANGGTVTIEGGTFSGNSATGAGGVIYVYDKTNVAISGGTFKGNTAGTNGNAIYIASGGTVTIAGGEFATETPAQEIYVAGTLNYSNVPEELIKGTGTKTKIEN